MFHYCYFMANIWPSHHMLWPSCLIKVTPFRLLILYSEKDLLLTEMPVFLPLPNFMKKTKRNIGKCMNSRAWFLLGSKYATRGICSHIRVGGKKTVFPEQLEKSVVWRTHFYLSKMLIQLFFLVLFFLSKFGCLFSGLQRLSYKAHI